MSEQPSRKFEVVLDRPHRHKGRLETAGSKITVRGDQIDRLMRHKVISIDPRPKSATTKSGPAPEHGGPEDKKES